MIDYTYSEKHQMMKTRKSKNNNINIFMMIPYDIFIDLITSYFNVASTVTISSTCSGFRKIITSSDVRFGCGEKNIFDGFDIIDENENDMFPSSEMEHLCIIDNIFIKMFIGFPNIISIDLSFCYYSNKMIKKLVHHCKKIEEFTISMATHDEIYCILKLSLLKKLTYDSMQHSNHLLDKAKHKRLETLGIRSSNTWNGTSTLCNAFAIFGWHCSNLHTIRFEYKISPNGKCIY